MEDIQDLYPSFDQMEDIRFTKTPSLKPNEVDVTKFSTPSEQSLDTSTTESSTGGILRKTSIRRRRSSKSRDPGSKTKTFEIRPKRSPRRSRKQVRQSPDSKHPRASAKILGVSHVNKFCETDLKECTNLRFGPVTYRGGGTFGSVFTAQLNPHHLIAIKMIVSIDPERKSPKRLLKKQIELQKEINMTVLMGREAIGPEVVDIANYLLNSNELPEFPLIQEIINKAIEENENVEIELDNGKMHELVVQFILMDAYEMDCEKALYKTTYHNDHPQILEQMVDLMRRQIEIGIYCYDIKPGNFVVNMSPLEVRMIDFGADYCNNNINDTFPQNEYLPSILKLMSVYDLLLFSNCLQLFLFLSIGYGKGEFFEKKSLIEGQECFRAIFKYFHTVYDSYTLDQILYPYVHMAYYYHELDLYKPPTMMMWYSEMKYTTTRQTIIQIKNAIEQFY